MANQRTAKVTEVLIHNPAQPRTWPGERTRNMANKKKGGKKKGGKRNSASVKSARPAAHKKATQNTAKPKSQKKGGYKRNGGSWLRNTLGGKIGGIGIPDVIGAGGGVLVGEAGAAVLPQSFIGDGLLLIGAVLVAKALASISLTKSFATGAGIGVGAVAFKNGLNRATNGAVTNFFLGVTHNVSGYLNPAPAQTTVDGAGMGNLASFPQRRFANVW